MRNLAYQDKVFISACFAVLLLVGVALLWNASHEHYAIYFQGVHCNALVLFFGFFAFYWVMLAMPEKHHLGILRAMAMLFMVITLKYCCDLAVLTSPFPTQDQLINKIDGLLGFHFLPVLLFFHAHTTAFFLKVMWMGYFSVLIFMQLLPLFYAAFQKTEQLYRFFVSFLMSLIIGYVLCYFFPTLTSPAAIYPHAYFTTLQIASVHNYELLHNHHAVNFDFIGSVVSFPSYHAICINFMVICLWEYPKMRLPLLLYGLFAMATLVLTGWHYLFDLSGGIVVALCSVSISDYFLSAKTSKYSKTVLRVEQEKLS